MRGSIQSDNEYFQSGYGQREYFAELEDTYRNGGILVPLTFNDAQQGRNFVNGTVSNFMSIPSTVLNHSKPLDRVLLTFMGWSLVFFPSNPFSHAKNQGSIRIRRVSTVRTLINGMTSFPTTASITNVSSQTQCSPHILTKNIPATNPGQPLYIPEFQAGSYDAWGPNAPGIILASIFLASH